MDDLPAGAAPVLLTFDDFIDGTEKFGTRIQPLMKCRAGVVSGPRPSPQPMAG